MIWFQRYKEEHGDHRGPSVRDQGLNNDSLDEMKKRGQKDI